MESYPPEVREAAVLLTRQGFHYERIRSELWTHFHVEPARITLWRWMRSEGVSVRDYRNGFGEGATALENCARELNDLKNQLLAVEREANKSRYPIGGPY
jgi:hypothetical protein